MVLGVLAISQLLALPRVLPSLQHRSHQILRNRWCDRVSHNRFAFRHRQLPQRSLETMCALDHRR